MKSIHTEFTVERVCNASVATCWKAWTDPALKARWFVADIEGWETLATIIDVRIGGREHTSARDADGVVHGNETVFLDIVEHQRIVFAYTMTMDERPSSASLVVLSFKEEAGKTRITYTEQGAYLDGTDGTALREGGVGWLYDKLKDQVESEAQS